MPVTAAANGAAAAAAAPTKAAGTAPAYDDPTEHYSDLQRARLDYVPPKPVVLQGAFRFWVLFFCRAREPRVVPLRPSGVPSFL